MMILQVGQKLCSHRRRVRYSNFVTLLPLLGLCSLWLLQFFSGNFIADFFSVSLSVQTVVERASATATVWLHQPCNPPAPLLGTFAFCRINLADWCFIIRHCDSADRPLHTRHEIYSSRSAIDAFLRRRNQSFRLRNIDSGLIKSKLQSLKPQSTIVQLPPNSLDTWIPR
jgi:hypothetical protein